MSMSKIRRVTTMVVLAALLVMSLATFVNAAEDVAPVAQGVRAQEVVGTLTGGQFAKIWLGLETGTKGEDITVITTWEVQNPNDQGLGFYVLDAEGLNRVLDGTSDVREANLSAGSKLSPESPDNELGAHFRATGDSYTIVLFNDSNSDANFSLGVTNSTIVDDSDQIRSATDAATTDDTDADSDTADAAADADADTATDDAATTDEDTTDTATTDADSTDTTATTDSDTTPATTESDTDSADATDTVTTTTVTTVSGEPGVVRAQELKGELPEQNDQHFLALEPSERDAQIDLLLSFEPQDSSELARRLNFWVLDVDGFARFVNPNESIVLSNIALAAGSSDPQLQSFERKASFSSSGLGPYTVIVYNNSTVPGTYMLQVDGGILIDDSGQTLTAQNQTTTTVTTTSTATTTDATDDDAADTTTDASTATDTDTPASSSREGEPGGTYTIQAGDSLSLIARDIYDDLSLWDEICAFNGLDNCDTIEVGDVIRLPTQAEIGAGVIAEPVATATTTETGASDDAATDDAATDDAATDDATADTDAETPSTDVQATTGVTSTTTVTDTEESGDAMASDEEDTPASTATVDIVEALEAEGNFETLVEALNAAGLTDALQGAGPFTILAPTDAAFAELPEGALDSLLANPTGQLTQILLFHVLPGNVTSADISDGMQATTQQGKAVSFEIAGDSVKVNGADVLIPDVVATNGTIHAISNVILPPPDEN